MGTAALLEEPTRVMFFTGKGGMGKTTLACATAVTLARRGARVLIVSTDPASNLDEVLETDLGAAARPVSGAPGLDAANIDPEAAAREYRERAVAPYRGVLPDFAVASIEESLSGACSVEIAAFDVFARLLADPGTTAGYDHVIFDTAPTGHTLRLLRLPAAWTDFIDTNTTGTSCLGPLAGLEAQRDLYAAAVSALTNAELTTVVLVSRPERGALTEAARTRTELADAGMRRQILALNGVFDDPGADPTARALARRHADALQRLAPGLASLDRVCVPLAAFAALGCDALEAILDPASDLPACREVPVTCYVPDAPLVALIDELELGGGGVVMTTGKGGVGKTTLAASIASELARRGHPVHLSTTDPAAHLAHTIGAATDGLTIARIDPAVEIRAYAQEVMDSTGGGLDEPGRALLEEDLRSPCTEEIAVFRAFARTVAAGQDGFVVLDTAPTGHTLLLLDAARSYHREIERSSSDIPESVAELLPRLRDPAYTRVLIVTLPEATPVNEARRLGEELRRAGINPWACVVNQSMSAVNPSHPTLAARANRECAHIAAAAELGPRLCVVPWSPNDPVGTARLLALAL